MMTIVDQQSAKNETIYRRIDENRPALLKSNNANRFVRTSRVYPSIRPSAIRVVQLSDTIVEQSSAYYPRASRGVADLTERMGVLGVGKRALAFSSEKSATIAIKGTHDRSCISGYSWFRLLQQLGMGR